MKTMGQLSVVLLICVLLGQGMWLYHVREIKLGEFRESANDVLLNTTYKYLFDEGLNFGKGHKLTYSLTKDHRFYWYYDNREGYIPIKSPDMVDKLGRMISYDCLYKHQIFDIFELNKMYIDYLKEKGITENPILKVLNIEGEELQSTGNLKKNCNSIMTLPIELGYENKHQLLATFELPFVFRALSGILWVELIFMIGFIFCLVWQWCSIRMTMRSARIQTMGMTHLEHELKKPLAAVTSALEGIVNRKNRELTAIQEEKLKMVEVRIRKMAEITDTMLVTLKNSRLEVERVSVDIVQEIGMVAEMFRILYPYARLEFQVETGEEKPLLDQVYFNYLVINLVDNAIKYGGDEPWVKVVFYRENWDWVLTVTDRGIGMPERVLKRIFRQFYRVKDKKVKNKTGFGLGLAFAKKVVNAYGGEIRVESAPGKGSRFEVRIKAE